MLNIHKAIQGEGDKLLELLEMQFVDHQIEFSREILRTAIDAMLGNKNLGFFLLAELGEQAVGFAAISFAWTLEYGGKTAWLDELYVLPAYRERGIGGNLVDAMLTEAKKFGCLAVDLEVEEGHERAEKLYRRKGFEMLTRRRWARELGDLQDVQDERTS